MLDINHHHVIHVSTDKYERCYCYPDQRRILRRSLIAELQHSVFDAALQPCYYQAIYFSDP